MSDHEITTPAVASSCYTHDDAMSDLEAMRVYGLNAKYTTPDEECARLAAYIKQLEARNDSLTKQLDFVTQERDNAEKWGRAQQADLAECRACGNSKPRKRYLELLAANMEDIRALWEAADKSTCDATPCRPLGGSCVTCRDCVDDRRTRAAVEATRHLFGEGGDE